MRGAAFPRFWFSIALERAVGRLSPAFVPSPICTQRSSGLHALHRTRWTRTATTTTTSAHQPFYQVDAFTDKPFGGNPAAIVSMDGRKVGSMFPTDEVMRLIAAENNLSETAFYGHIGGSDYNLRWFTPKSEVDMCGHATLATAHIIFSSSPGVKRIAFHTRSGRLETSISETGLIEMELPAQDKAPLPHLTGSVGEAIGCEVKEVHWTHGQRHGLAILTSPSDVIALNPDIAKVSALPFAGVICAAKGAPPGEDGLDFVYRYFAPSLPNFEDAATGSAQCSLMPYWSKILGKDVLSSSQLSSRRAGFRSVLRGNKVLVSGKAFTVIKGAIHVPDK